jgi:hypothetical protein
VSFAEAARLYANASNNANLDPIGVACHIGSQITDLAPMRAAFTKMRGLVEQLRGEGLSVERLDLGGGLGVPYFNMPEPPSPADYRGDGRRGHQGPGRHWGGGGASGPGPDEFVWSTVSAVAGALRAVDFPMSPRDAAF